MSKAGDPVASAKLNRPRLGSPPHKDFALGRASAQVGILRDRCYHGPSNHRSEKGKLACVAPASDRPAGRGHRFAVFELQVPAVQLAPRP